MFHQSLGFGGLLILLADVWAIINVVQSSADAAKKAVWIVLILVLPVAGFLLWLFLGPRSGRS